MINKKMISLAVLSIGVCSLAVATDYKALKTEFKGHSPAKAEMQAADLDENYKVEGAVMTDRQIASEEESDREPSSLKADAKKKEPFGPQEKIEPVDPEMVPKPWLYRTQSGSEK